MITAYQQKIQNINIEMTDLSKKKERHLDLKWKLHGGFEPSSFDYKTNTLPG